jgi:hypothetical protein
VKGIPKLVIANEEAVAAVWPSALLLIPGICVIRFDSVVIACSDLFEVYSSLCWLSVYSEDMLSKLEIIQLLQPPF